MEGEAIIEIVVALAVAGGGTVAFILAAAEHDHRKAVRARLREIETRRDQGAWGEVVNFPEGLRRTAPKPGRVASAARSQSFARHIAHDSGPSTR